jgi:molecular chaperone GrpE
MARTNGKPEVDPGTLDVDHELPASDEEEDKSAAATAKEEAGAGEGGGPANELQSLKAERDLLLDRLARVQADFQNARKRAAKEQQDFRDYALAEAIKSLLPILDSFERALKASSAPADEFRNGVELIYKQLQDALAKLGVRPIPAQGEAFDPHLHQAIEMVETTQAKDQHVVEELQRGYKLKDRLLRPSMVRVAKNSKR